MRAFGQTAGMPVPRSSVSKLLSVYFISVVVAVLTRFDEFPWTWVPMYSTYEAKDDVTIPIRDKADLSNGLIATHRNGATSRIDAKRLNVPSRNYWRIHLQRMNGQGAAKYAQARLNLSELNLWLRGGFAEPVNWDRRILESLNRTLGFSPADPDFIVAAKAPATHAVVNKRTLEAALRRVEPEVRWDDDWNREWDGASGR